MMSIATCKIPSAVRRICCFLGLFAAACLLCGCDAPVSEKARRRFENRSGSFSVTIFPVLVTAGNQTSRSRELARRLSLFLQSRQLAEPRISKKAIEMPAYYGAAETKRIRLSIRHLQQAVRHIDLTTDYALMAEIVFNPEKTKVLGVYFYLADRFARIASARMANAHHREFRKIQPRTEDEAFSVLKEMIREGWPRSSRSSQPSSSSHFPS